MLSGMPKPPKVVPIDEQEYRLVALDEKAHRVIASIGGQCYALDFFTRIARLPRATGDRANKVLRMKQGRAPDQRQNG